MEDSDDLPLLDEDELDRLGAVLAAELRLARDDTSQAVDIAILSGAMHGDASLTSLLAERALTVLLLRRELDIVDRYFVAQLLMLISGGVAADIFSGVLGDRRGGVKNGGKSLAVAFSVVEALEEKRATSLEEAWAIAADQFGIGEDMAKRHWTRWKKKILWSMSDEEVLSPSLKRAKTLLGEFDP